jgi:RNA polymerase sigma-70 factor, ECF subfamily
MSALSLRRTLLALSRTRLAPLSGRLDTTSLYVEHADFVWLSLQRLGVRPADLEDVLQEVFIVVHQQVGGFEGRSKPTTWLFGICLRVAAAYRRRAHRRREESSSTAADRPDDGDDPEALTAALEARRRLDAALDSLELEKRAVLVMFEIDGMSCQAIADLLELRVGTVYSRLHAARGELQKALERQRTRERFRELGT